MSKYRNSRSGTLVPLMAVLIVALLSLAALTINSSWLMYNQINVQNSADLSSRSGLVKLIGDTEFEGRIDRARDLAVRMYDLNIDREGASIDPESVRFGIWSEGQGDDPSSFDEKFDDNDPISAVHVDQPTRAQDRNVKVYLSQFLGGRDSLEVVSEATSNTRNVDIMLSLDVSRSMNQYSEYRGDVKYPPGTDLNTPPHEDSRYFEMIATVKIFLDAMRDVNPNARVGLVTFGGGPLARNRRRNPVVSPLDDDKARFEEPLSLVLSPQISRIPETLESYIDYPALGLGTSIYEAVRLPSLNFDDIDSSKHIVLLSDGDQALVDSPAPINAVDFAMDRGILVHTIAFATDDRQLNEIADATGGAKYSAGNEEELREAFAQLLGRFRTQLVE